jgi:hypothetical protein
MWTLNEYNFSHELLLNKAKEKKKGLACANWKWDHRVRVHGEQGK